MEHRRWPYLLVVVLVGSCLGLGGVAWYVLRKDRQLRAWERRESEQLLAQQLAQTLQQSVQRQLALLQSLPSSKRPVAWAQQLQQTLPSEPWFWHAVALDRDGEIQWPSLLWEGPDDGKALSFAQTLSCQSFQEAASSLQVGQAARLASALILQQRLSRCSLFAWTKVALLRDFHARWRSSRSWRYSSSNDKGYWLLRSRSSLMIVRSHPQGWAGFALRLRHNLREGIPTRWRVGLRSVWLDRQPRLATPSAHVSYASLPEVLSGYALFLDSGREDQAVSWLLAGLVTLCLLLASWTGWLIVRLLQQQHRMMQQREEWFSSITHELKTPVAAQLALLDTLSREQLSVEQRTKYQGTLRREILRLQRLVENVLALQRDAFPPRNQTHVDMTALCHSLLEEFEMQAIERGMELICEHRTPLYVFCDAGELSLCLRHLIDNAIKYSHREGWVQVELEGTQQTVEIVVRDSGPGVPPELQERLWEPFERGDDRNESGSGLGLYLARRILLRHHGSLDWVAHLSQGVFQVKLPRSYPDKGQMG
ncbi:MAG: HAMP domain-containing histidine kinase [Deltaproteobacteria bacterium]|nr:MAG: HAMP domain-containing histidine kinase [Deltaproteobacteria bacterium]